MVLAFDAHDDALGVHRVDDPVASGENYCSRVASRNPFHSRADDRRLRAEQRHGLALHVAPISARFASSCSRKGTSEAATDTNCFGLTST